MLDEERESRNWDLKLLDALVLFYASLPLKRGVFFCFFFFLGLEKKLFVLEKNKENLMQRILTVLVNKHCIFLLAPNLCTGN